MNAWKTSHYEVELLLKLTVGYVKTHYLLKELFGIEVTDLPLFMRVKEVNFLEIAND